MTTTILRDGTERDWLPIDSLRKKEGNALGFIPKDAYLSVLGRVRLRDRARFETQRILITEDNGDLTGFAYASFYGPITRIIQIVVRQDARRWYRAMLMADEIEKDAEKFCKQSIKCRVAYDLESNQFWRAIGYVPLELVTSSWLNQRESKSKRPLWIYEKRLPQMFPSALLVAEPHDRLSLAAVN